LIQVGCGSRVLHVQLELMTKTKETWGTVDFFKDVVAFFHSGRDDEPKWGRGLQMKTGQNASSRKIEEGS